ncbi:MAG: sulfurtransferase TusA family protein [Thermoplasmata archaeon]
MTQANVGLKADKVVDARGMACPGPLLEAKRAMASVPNQGILEVISSDEGTTTDVPLWAKKVGHEYLGTTADAGFWRIFVRRMK